MERVALVLALLVYAVTGVRYYRTPRDEADLGTLRYARVGDRRTVEVWQKGLGFKAQVFDTY
ncbi:hypothetical protein ACIPLC_27115 [Kitasatospora sp. NPDC086801]|uniref:hypothetical protein n=1 Tax=Kitasatospora sp. NPDC086801 TaxID=3364066 RepID=UPI0037F1646B